MRLEGKIIVVTGAARGIGKVYAKNIAAEGGKVVVSDVLDGDGTVEEIHRSGGEAIFVRADVADEGSTEALANAANEEFGRIDGLVNNAAICADVRYCPIDQVTSEEWDAVMAVNVKGVWLASKAVYPYMKGQGSGKIVNIASVTSFLGYTDIPHYVVSKGAVVTLTRVLARSMGKDGICVNAVGPGLTRSDSIAEVRGPLFDEEEAPLLDMRAIPRRQYPDDLVGAILFFLSDASDFIAGQTLLVDGGIHMN
ncbi:MAG: SDR family oxidoreductase [Nitrospinota bacterium]|jgi:NAD(P)-dependent dehydrogenase (short-subunit alcohol dehydrogenase family)|nr:SDR family oxidoreductase [Nitrospinota bacterium]